MDVQLDRLEPFYQHPTLSMEPIQLVYKVIGAVTGSAPTISLVIFVVALADMIRVLADTARATSQLKKLDKELRAIPLLGNESTYERIRKIAGATWPTHECVRPILDTLNSVQTSSVPDLDSPLQIATGKAARRGAYLKPLASILILLSLLATFAKMREATNELSKSLRTASEVAQSTAGKTVVGEATARDARDENYQKFRQQVNGALDAMSTAFGANLMGIFFAALILLTLPFIRYKQVSLLSRLRAIVDQRIRTRLVESDEWTGQTGQQVRRVR